MSSDPSERSLGSIIADSPDPNRTARFAFCLAIGLGIAGYGLSEGIKWVFGTEETETTVTQPTLEG